MGFLKNKDSEMKQRLAFLFRFCVLLSFLPFIESKASASNPDSLKVRNFVIKTSIILTNSKPSKDKIADICSRFKLYADFEKGSSKYLDSLISSQAFGQNVYDRYRYEYLQGVSEWEISDEIDQYRILTANKGSSELFDLFNSYIDKLIKLNTAGTDFATGKIGLPELQKRFFDNKFYDDINMGSNNFVVSTYNYIFFRNPTKVELASGREMIEGEYARILFKNGNSKQQYLDILFSSRAYIEGQIRYWYSQLLNREPHIDEMFWDNSKPFDAKELIKNILMKKEFSKI